MTIDFLCCTHLQLQFMVQHCYLAIPPLWKAEVIITVLQSKYLLHCA